MIEWFSAWRCFWSEFQQGGQSIWFESPGLARNSLPCNTEGLDKRRSGDKIPEIPANPFLHVFDEGICCWIYDLKAVLAPSERRQTLQTPARANRKPRRRRRVRGMPRVPRDLRVQRTQGHEHRRTRRSRSRRTVVATCIANHQSNHAHSFPLGPAESLC